MLQEVWPDDFGVHDDAAVVVDGRHAPDEEDALQEPVEWNHLGDVQREELEDREAGEDHPVSQPFGVVALVFRLHGLHRHVRWVGDTDDVTENLRGISKGEV